MVYLEMVFSSTAKRRVPATAFLLVFYALGTWGCGIKSQVQVPIPPKAAAARTATLPELLSMLQGYDDRVRSLSCTSMKLSLTTGKAESGTVEEYRAATGYILLQRPDDILLNIQNPITKTAMVELLSKGDEFEIWNRRDNKIYIGRNSAAEFALEANSPSLALTARPIQIYQAILPQSLALDAPGRKIAMTEAQDAEARYYVLTLFQETEGPELETLRRLWIERSQMVVVKEESFTPSGQVSGTVTYGDLTENGGLLLPHRIVIDRPLDGYRLDMQFRTWRVNPDLPEDAFRLNAPESVERVYLKEKSRS